ncbi:hypothetical protein [Cellulomonas sp. P5_C6]
MAGRWRVVAVVAVLALAGCTGGAPAARPPSPRATPTPIPADVLAGLSVEVRQARSDWALRVVQLNVANAGPGDVTVERARLITPDDAGVATSDRERPVRAGVDRDVSVALGEPVCDDATSGPAQAELDLVDDAGRQSTLVVQPGDPQGHLARIHGEDCAAAAVARGATLSLEDAITTSDVDGTLAATVDLRVVPVLGGPTVEITQVDGTVLLAPVGGATSWPTTVDTADGAEDTVPLELVPSRCDPHAVAEDKRGTFFGVHTRVDGVDQPVFYLASSDVLRGALHEFVGRSCGMPGAG